VVQDSRHFATHSLQLLQPCSETSEPNYTYCRQTRTTSFADVISGKGSNIRRPVGDMTRPASWLNTLPTRMMNTLVMRHRLRHSQQLQPPALLDRRSSFHFILSSFPLVYFRHRASGRPKLVAAAIGFSSLTPAATSMSTVSSEFDAPPERMKDKDFAYMELTFQCRLRHRPVAAAPYTVHMRYS